jgi:hypothetical protein
MTTTLDAVPFDVVGRHVAADDCPCRPIPGRDLADPTQPVRLHRHSAPEAPPPEADALLWHRDRRGNP